jgi:hypothetical protein
MCPTFYNSAAASLGYVDAASNNVTNLTWQYRGGRITTPANTATVRVALINHLNSGWVAFDDVMLTAVTTSTATIQRKSYFLGGTAVATRVSGYYRALSRGITWQLQCRGADGSNCFGNAS